MTNKPFSEWILLAQAAPAAAPAPAPAAAPGATISAPPSLVGSDAPPAAAQPGLPSTGASGAAPGTGQLPQGQPGGLGGSTFLLLMFGLLAFLLLTSFLSSRKEKKRRDELLGSLASNDRVQTVGGIIGTIAELKDDELTLRVDEISNTRIRFARTAVQQVLRKSGAPAADAKK